MKFWISTSLCGLSMVAGVVLLGLMSKDYNAREKNPKFVSGVVKSIEFNSEGEWEIRPFVVTAYYNNNHDSAQIWIDSRTYRKLAIKDSVDLRIGGKTTIQAVNNIPLKEFLKSKKIKPR